MVLFRISVLISLTSGLHNDCLKEKRIFCHRRLILHLLEQNLIELPLTLSPPQAHFVDKGGGQVYNSATRLMFVTGEFDLSGFLIELKRFYLMYSMPAICVSLIDKKAIISNAIFEHIFFAFPNRTHLGSNFRCEYRDTNKSLFL